MKLLDIRFCKPIIQVFRTVTTSTNFKNETVNKHQLNYEDSVSIRKNHLGPQLKHLYKQPLYITNGKFQWLFDHTGRKYLDMFGGIVTVSVGHCHPKVSDALKMQSDTLWHTSSLYMHPKIQEYTQKLLAKMPPKFDFVCLVNSGSEANDLAMLMSRLHTKNFDIISLRNGYHGSSPYTMGITAHAPWRFPMPGINNGIQHAMNPDPFVGPWGGSHCRDSISQTYRKCNCAPSEECEAGVRYYEQLEELFKYSMPKKQCAGMFIESMQGIGGVVQYPKGYVAKAADLIRENGGVFISDEVQTGFGRTGEHFWGFEGLGILPDIVTMAKGMGNGFPMAAVVTTNEIAQSLQKAAIFNTFGGNPLACAVGISVLDVIEEEKLQENSSKIGTYFINGLQELQNRFEIIGDVRGKGLMIGVELVENRDTKKPLAGAKVDSILEDCKESGVLIGKGGVNGNVLRIKPPMCINLQDVAMTLDSLEKSLKNIK